MKTTMKKLIPNLMVSDVVETVEFYRDNFGFELSMSVPEGGENAGDMDIFFEPFDPNKKYLYVLMKNGDVEISFQEAESFKGDIPVLKESQIGASATQYIQVEGVDEIYENLKDKVQVIKGPTTAWYGMRELYVSDNNGYVLCLGEQAN